MEKHTIYLIVIINVFLAGALFILLKKLIKARIEKNYKEKISRLKAELQKTEINYINLLHDEGYTTLIKGQNKTEHRSVENK